MPTLATQPWRCDCDSFVLNNIVYYAVAVTRAKALLIIIGDPKALSLDPMWRRFLNYIHRCRGWEGEAPNWDTRAPVDRRADFIGELRMARLQETNDLARRIGSVKREEFDEIVAKEEEEDDENDVSIDRPWADAE